MARWNPDDYETVEQRIRRFYDTYADGRIITECVVTGQDGTWLFKAFIYLSEGEQAAGLPKATGYASEREGGPQTEWKAELGETSAIGRALANMNMSGNKRASREEMEKVSRSEDRDWLAEANSTTDVKQLRVLWANARQNGVDKTILKQLEERARGLADSEGGDS